ncbi:MAG: hypothetical protein R3E97_21265 [Candidatus Eisenbacteria bacterium]
MTDHIAVKPSSGPTPGGWTRLSRRLALFSSALVAATLVACAEKEATVLVDDSGLATRVDTSLALSPLLYPDGQLTLNDRCPVRKVGLNPRMPAIYVNQHPVGFC